LAGNQYGSSIGYNFITTVPAEITQLSNLFTLILDGNYIYTISPEIMTKLNNIKILGINAQLPPEFREMLG
jgi:Leucine-rich repeat (LRR) protein